MSRSVFILLFIVGCFLSCCARSSPSSTDIAQDVDPSASGPMKISVHYESRHATLKGFSSTLEDHPVRFADFEVLSKTGEILARGATDNKGQFELPRLLGAERLFVWSKIKSTEHDIAVTYDAEGRQPYKISISLENAGAQLEVLARDQDSGGLGGAFHILDTMLTGLVAAERWSRRQMPAVYVHWARGITQNWSFYRGERPEGSGRHGFELLGGLPGMQATTDSDEHDEVIILHELGHLVMNLISTDSSLGGRHPPGAYIDPGLAWEEGRVSWFAAAVLGDPLYRDAIGMEPQGKLRVDRNYSQVNPGPQGIGSEQTVGEVLWDLADGAGGIPDEDDDGIALGPVGLVEAMMDIVEEDGAYPCLSSFLFFLVSSGRISESDLKTMLARAGHPESVIPGPGEMIWPRILEPPATVEGFIDGLTQPAPSGGPALPLTGFDAVHAYRVRLPMPSRLELRLTIQGTGRAVDRSNLNMEVRDIRARKLVEARTERQVEELSPLLLPAGWYVIYIRDGGEGNRARYRLEVSVYNNH